ncbi:MAG: hypothetical protein IPF93_15725 [Saprospiraceae bacterium]|nr:hypothetical protein [Saprospiraceae bacterium]
MSSSNTVLGDQIFLEEGAKVEACILNSQIGLSFLGKDAEVMGRKHYSWSICALRT